MAKETQKTKRLREYRHQSILKWLAGAVVTVGAAVVEAVNPLAAAEAKFLSFGVAGTDLVYEAYVDAAYDDSGDAEIQIVARDQFGERIQTVWTGRSAGVFTELDPGTDYDLLIRINRGFGWNVLASEKVRTADGPGGAIVGYELLESSGQFESSLWQYSVQVHVVDPEAAFTAVRFRYAPLYQYDLAYMGALTPDEYLGSRFVSVAVEGPDATIALPEMWREPFSWYWYLEAETAEGTVLLDARIVASPPAFYGYVSVIGGGADHLDVEARAHPVEGVEAVFTLNVIDNADNVVRSLEIAPTPSDESGEQPFVEPLAIRIDKLLRDRIYRLELVATYVDPETGFAFTTLVAWTEGVTTTVEAGGAISSYDWTETLLYQDMLFWNYVVQLELVDPYYEYQYFTFRYAYLTEFERQSLGSTTVAEFLTDRWTSVMYYDDGPKEVALPDMWREPFTWYWVLEAHTAEGIVVLDEAEVASPPVFPFTLMAQGSTLDSLTVGVALMETPATVATYAVRILTDAGTLVEEVAFVPGTPGMPVPVTFDGLAAATFYRIELVATFTDAGTGTVKTSLVTQTFAMTATTLP